MSNVWIGVLVVVVIVVLGGMMNLVSEDSEVRGQAEIVACGALACSRGGQVKPHRTVLDETIEYELPKTGEAVTVKCTRLAVFLGPYTCEKQ